MFRWIIISIRRQVVSGRMRSFLVVMPLPLPLPIDVIEMFLVNDHESNHFTNNPDHTHPQSWPQLLSRLAYPQPTTETHANLHIQP